jgi:hypothetical protein
MPGPVDLKRRCYRGYAAEKKCEQKRKQFVGEHRKYTFHGRTPFVEEQLVWRWHLLHPHIDWPEQRGKIAANESNCNEQCQILRAIMKRFNRRLPLYFMGVP